MLRAVFRLALRQTEGLIASVLHLLGLDLPVPDHSTIARHARAAGPVAALAGDGAYDRTGVYAAVHERHPEAAVLVPPRADAVLSDTAETAPTQRDRHIQTIAETGRIAW